MSSGKKHTFLYQQLGYPTKGFIRTEVKNGEKEELINRHTVPYGGRKMDIREALFGRLKAWRGQFEVPPEDNIEFMEAS